MYRNILLPIDLDEESSWHTALPMALEYCRAFGPSSLHVLNVVPGMAMGASVYLPDDTDQKLMEGASTALTAFVAENVPDTIDAHHVVGQGSVYHVILEVAEKVGADLIIMAAHRPALSDYLLGPNAARVVRHAACSVLVVREQAGP
jgi:nucleotide-binding universal stress UspA family protein